MKTVRIIYHREPEAWSADSPDLPGWSAAGDTYDEVRALAVEGARFFAEEPCVIEEAVPVVTQGTGVQERPGRAWGAVARAAFSVVVVTPTIPGQPGKIISDERLSPLAAT